MQETLALLVRTSGFELAARLVNDLAATEGRIDDTTTLIEVVQKDLPGDVAKVVVGVLAGIIHAPTAAQASVLAALVRAYLGVAIMGLDPYLSELQQTRISGKIFTLCTDVVINALISEHPSSTSFRAIVSNLIAAGCRVIIPPTVLAEVANHASIARRTYAHFGEALHLLSPEVVEEKVYNAFVVGFYQGRQRGTLSERTDFNQYIQNYHDTERPVAFLQEIIQNLFGANLQFMPPSELLASPVSESTLENMKTALIQTSSHSRKAEYRRPEESDALAERDARLFLSTTMLNPPRETDQTRVLGGKCYLVTNALKYMRAAKQIGIDDVVTANPASIIAILEIIGNDVVDEPSFLKLIGNPFLSQAVEQSWDDIEVLVRNGIDLRDKSLARLRWDLDTSLHARIVELKAAEDSEQTEVDETTDRLDEAYLSLVETAVETGYPLSTPVASLHSELEKARTETGDRSNDLRNLQEKYEHLEKQIEIFGKRRQKYLRKQASIQEGRK